VIAGEARVLLSQQFLDAPLRDPEPVIHGGNPDTNSFSHTRVGRCLSTY
jgi:hypothetical protein